MRAGPPGETIAVPAGVRAVAAGRPLGIVWRNELGGLTFEVGAGDDGCFVKWTPAGSPIDPGADEVRLAWAAGVRGRCRRCSAMAATPTDPVDRDRRRWRVRAR